MQIFVAKNMILLKWLSTIVIQQWINEQQQNVHIYTIYKGL